MPIAPLIAEEQTQFVPSEHLKLLVGCLILGFALCSSMVMYTNHLKETLTALAQVPNPGSSVVETMAPLSLRTPERLEITPIAHPQSLEVSFKAQSNKQKLSRTTSKQDNLIAHGTWSQTDFPHHAHGAFIEMQRQTAKRKNAKEKSSRSPSW
jgi:hypothetical protein